MTVSVSVDRGLARTLADCALGESSGIVSAVRGKHKRLFCLSEGRITFAGSNVIEEQFTERLLEEKLIAVGDLAGARQEAERQGVKLTRLLVNEAVIVEPKMIATIEEYVRGLLYSTLDWSGSESNFTRGLPSLADEVTVDMPCVPLLMDYASRFPESLAEVRLRIGSPSAKLVLNEERGQLLDGLSVSPGMTHFLAKSDGVKTIDRLIERSPEREEPAWRSLYALWLLGLVERSTAREAAEAPEAATREEILARVERATTSDHYGVLDLTQSATAEKLRESYYRLARKYHPDRYGAGPLADLREMLESYFAKVTEAYNTLYDPASRAEYDELRASQEDTTATKQDASFLANENFRRAQALVARGRFMDATQSMENAIQLDPRNPTYRLEAGRLLGRNPRLRQRAVEHLIEVNRLDPSLAEGYYELGELYLKMSQRAKALELFRETLRWEVGHIEASARIRELGKV